MSPRGWEPTVIPRMVLLDQICPRCTHRHTDASWGFICIGCPCDWTPAAPGSPRADREQEALDKLAEDWTNK